MDTAQLKKQYKEQIVPALQKQFNYCLLYTSDAADE